MKIIVAGPVGRPGGLQTHFSELIQFLHEEGHNVLAIKIEVNGSDVNSSNSPNGESQEWTIQWNASAFFRTLQWLRAIWNCLRFKPDVLISVSNGYGYVMLGTALKGCLRIKTDVTDNWPIGERLHEKMAQTYDATVVQSQGLLQAQWNRIRTPVKAAVLPCFSAADTNRFIARDDFETTPIQLAYFGRLARNKGLFELIEVLGKDSHANRFHVDIWGAGEIAEELDQKIRTSELTDRVALRGHYPSGDAQLDLMTKYHGLVLPSQYSEGLPLVLLEASSVGLPFLSCNVGAIQDCEVDNPDCIIIETGTTALEIGIRGFVAKIRCGLFQQRRLKEWFDKNHSRAECRKLWRKFLEQKHEFFKHDA